MRSARSRDRLAPRLVSSRPLCLEFHPISLAGIGGSGTPPPLTSEKNTRLRTVVESGSLSDYLVIPGLSCGALASPTLPVAQQQPDLD